MTQIVHDGEISSALNISENIRILRKKIFEEKYLEDLIERYLLSNTHSVRIIMKSDVNYHEEQGELEKVKLNKIMASLTQEDIQEIKKDNEILEKE